VLAIIAGLTIILSAVYMLRMYQRIMYGERTVVTEDFEDLSISEILLFVPIIISIFWAGISPSFALQMLEEAVKQLIN
jgi:NADH-quinone oxidoreductase subunit M